MPALLEAPTEAINPIEHSGHSKGYDDIEDDGLEGSGIDPVQELDDRLEHSRIAGEYYRSLSANYAELHDVYERTGKWPDHPFPNERYLGIDI